MSLPSRRVPLRVHSAPRGVALVVILAVLVILALMAATLAVLVQIETGAAAINVNRGKLDLLMDGGIEHARAVLGTTQPATSGLAGTQDALLARQFGDEQKGALPWFNVRDSRGTLVGRYRIRIENEAGKANLNAACLTAPSKGSGWNPSEINLAQALGVPPRDAARVMAFRYGNDGKPGMAAADDDRNDPILMSDGIDNNANGVIDEEGEGIDDPGEYSLHHLYGDDRMFCGIGEAASVMFGQTQFASPADRYAARRSFLRSATIYSEDMTGSPTLPDDEPADINCMTAREARSRIDIANKAEPFEPVALRRTQLALNMVDYRDQNHVLSTLGSIYGVEAVCFNEVLANDLSMMYSISLFSIPPNGWCESSPGYPKGGLWEVRYGSIDPSDQIVRGDAKRYTKKRPIFNIAFPYSTCLGDGYQTFGPENLWHVAPGVSPKSKFSLGGSVQFTLPDRPGYKGEDPGAISGFGSPANLPNSEWAKGSRGWGTGGGPPEACTYMYQEIMDVLKKRGKALNDHPKLPDNFFVGMNAMFYMWKTNQPSKPIGSFKVTKSSDHSFTAQSSDVHGAGQFRKLWTQWTNVANFSVSFDGWGVRGSCVAPKANGLYMIYPRTKKANRYYKVQITRDPEGYLQGNKIHTLGVSGSPSANKFSTETQKVWDYQDGEPVRTDGAGWLDVLLTSSPDCKYVLSKANCRGQQLAFIRVSSPEVVEMYNASDNPISLANWRVICNTGSLATEIGRIKRTAYYDTIAQKPLVDDNPCVRPGDYFYLVNDTKLFDAHYGNADFNWGSTSKEQLPVFQMDQQRWGICYEVEKILSAKDNDRYLWTMMIVKVKGEKFKKDLFKYEVLQFLYPNKTNPDDDSYDKVLASVIPHPENSSIQRLMGENSFLLENNYVAPWTKGDNNAFTYPKFEPGMKVMVLGLPNMGGIVSLTLKDQYEQICARTVNYGALTTEEFDYSSEKSDPTHATWIKQSVPTIGGTTREAKNNALSARLTKPSSVKDAAYGSVGGLRHVSTSSEFETLGDSGNKSRQMLSMAALANTFSASALRLEALDGNVVHSGWKDASAAVDSSSANSIRAQNAHWEANQWNGHILRFTSGSLRNQMFPVFGNSPDTLYLSMSNSLQKPLSAPDRMVLNPQRDDLFSLGPGYTTACAYSRKSNQQGEWLWKRRVPVRGKYYLYIYGLSDAVSSTEFLEENNNAPLDIEVWNWDTSAYDMLCQRERYRKEDCISAGSVLPAHVSRNGDFKIRITPHDVQEFQQTDTSGKSVNSKRRSGFAWFNFAMLSPVPVVGRVNVNSASARLLSSLPGVSSNLAVNIAAGIDVSGRRTLKPYRALGGLLPVAGMNLDVFERIANLVCLSGDSFTIDVEAQVVSDINNNGVFDENSGDKVLARRHRRSVLVRTQGTAPAQYQVAERYDP